MYGVFFSYIMTVLKKINHVVDFPSHNPEKKWNKDNYRIL